MKKTKHHYSNDYNNQSFLRIIPKSQFNIRSMIFLLCGKYRINVFFTGCA